MVAFFCPPPLLTVSDPLTLTFVASAISSTASITIPAGAAIGDIAVFFDHGTNGNNGPPAKVQPASWLQAADFNLNGSVVDARISAYYKVLTTGEPGSSISGITTASTTTTRKVMFVFRPSRPATSVTPSTWLGEISLNALSDQTIPLAGQPSPALALGFVAGRSGTNIFSPESPTFDAKVSSTGLAMGGYTIYSGPTADHLVGKSTDTGDGNLLTTGYLLVS